MHIHEILVNISIALSVRLTRLLFGGRGIFDISFHSCLVLLIWLGFFFRCLSTIEQVIQALHGHEDVESPASPREEVEVAKREPGSLRLVEGDVGDAASPKDQQEPNQKGVNPVSPTSLKQAHGHSDPDKSDYGTDTAKTNAKLDAFAFVVKSLINCVSVVGTIHGFILARRSNHDDETGREESTPHQRGAATVRVSSFALASEELLEVAEEDKEGRDERSPAEKVEVRVRDASGVTQDSEIVVRFHDGGNNCDPKSESKQGQASFHRSINELIPEQDAGKDGQGREYQGETDSRDSPFHRLVLVFDTAAFKVRSHGDQRNGGKGGNGEPLRLARLLFLITDRHGD